MKRLMVVALAWAGLAGAQMPIAVDVGHFLDKPGALSAHGITEFEYNHDLAAVIATRLQNEGLPVHLIGHRGDMADLKARSAEAAEAGARVLLSVHHDSVKEHHLQPWTWNGRALRHADGFAGFSLFVSRRNPLVAQSLACASAIGAELRRAGLPIATHHDLSSDGIRRPWADEANGVYYYDNLIVLRTAAMPALLLEAGVIVNRQEERELATPARRALTAEAVAKGLAACGMTNQSEAEGSELR
ncbi:N-acetylmuramoyl-L-alanine amidase [Zoogloea sp.]|uniref:N-acetylmuramoyl-L-alanine amidase family protein n=1 Tax=Zoogloea sp. TaxID=49181 RepID=UPI00262499F6|nr:N-acetylmuramoyl-L-alanine amidase [Zoogloea sp.]MDD3354619.1 N-acetylmuramoyl-L-alanine amidase [Zoogloea sp.]